MATYGNTFTGYEPSPTPGLTNFILKDGRKVPIFGPQAEALKAKLDQAKAMAPQPTAQIRPGDLVPPEGGFKPTAFGAPQPMQLDVGPAPTPGAPAPAQSVPVNPLPQSVAAPPPADPTNLGLGHRMGPDGRIYVEEAPRAPSKGGMVERARTVQGAVPLDPAFEERQQDAFISQKAAAELGFEAADEDAVAKAAFEKRALENARNAEDEARAERDVIRDRVAQMDAEYEQRKKAFVSAKVDPARLLAGGRNWIYGLAAGLGTFGAALSRTPNFALQVIEQRIADDIRAQEGEVAVKRDAADNAYKDLLRLTGSSELAKKELAGLQMAKLRAQLEVEARDPKNKARQADALALLAGLDKGEDRNRQDRIEKTYGVVTKSMVNVPGSAGSPGGWRPASDQIGTARGIQEVRKGEQAIAKAGEPKGGGRQTADIDAALAGLDDLDLTHAQAGRPGVLTTGYFGGETSQSLGSKADALAPVLGRALEGNAPNESTMASIREGLLSKDGDKVQKSIAAYRDLLEQRKRAILANPGGSDDADRERK